MSLSNQFWARGQDIKVNVENTNVKALYPAELKNHLCGQEATNYCRLPYNATLDIPECGEHFLMFLTFVLGYVDIP